jgi:hypothetical protein
MTRLLIAAGLLAAAFASVAAELITADEAGLPNAERKAQQTRAITRGPGINLISPHSGGASVQSPFDLRLEFVQRGGAKIDLETVKVLYDKNPPVNLIERVRTGVSETGIVLAGAQVPAGKHSIIVSVADSDGRSTTRTFELTVSK